MKAHGKDVKPLDKEAMLEYVQKSGGKVIAKKGATFYAVSATVCQLVGLILAASDSLATVSSMLHGEYGIEDVCLSTLTLVGPNGIQGKVQMRMNKEEVELLEECQRIKGSNRADRALERVCHPAILFRCADRCPNSCRSPLIFIGQISHKLLTHILKKSLFQTCSKPGSYHLTTPARIPGFYRGKR